MSRHEPPEPPPASHARLVRRSQERAVAALDYAPESIFDDPFLEVRQLTHGGIEVIDLWSGACRRHATLALAEQRESRLRKRALDEDRAKTAQARRNRRARLRRRARRLSDLRPLSSDAPLVTFCYLEALARDTLAGLSPWDQREVLELSLEPERFSTVLAHRPFSEDWAQAWARARQNQPVTSRSV